MNYLLIFFSFPFLIIIGSNILQGIIKDSLKVSLLTYALTLVYLGYNGISAINLLLLIIYTSLSFLTCYFTNVYLKKINSFSKFDIEDYLIDGEIKNDEKVEDNFCSNYKRYYR